MKITSIVGCRPQFVKLAAMPRRLAKTDHVHEIIHTGQHYDDSMSRSFFADLGIPEPTVTLRGPTFGLMLDAAEQRLEDSRPDVVLVYGDTDSTLAGALAAKRLNLPLAHIEAGLRSFDRTMPEEINRVAVDAISDLRFTTTPSAQGILERSAYVGGTYIVGNLMAETLLAEQPGVEASGVLERLGIRPREYAVLTLHRPGNLNDTDRMIGICKGIRTPPLPIVWPVHPRVSSVREIGGPTTPITPLGYHDFGRLVRDARFVLTDSGGVQEEAMMYGKPCITLRDNTERPETLTCGNTLVGADPAAIAQAIAEAMTTPPMLRRFPEFWDSEVSARILEHLEQM
jgi:UDP-N-acetylglucosamine 2-epimerase (non-hydrolysing)